MNANKAVVQNKDGLFLHQNEGMWVREYPDAGLFQWGKALRLATNLDGSATKNYGHADATIFTPSMIYVPQ